MKDVQNLPDERRIANDQVGVSELRYPIVVLDRDRQTQQTVARITMSVSLPHHFKGTHMSLFILRNVAAELREDTRVAWFRVHVVNHESIHNHSAFARIEWSRPSARLP